MYKRYHDPRNCTGENQHNSTKFKAHQCDYGKNGDYHRLEISKAGWLRQAEDVVGEEDSQTDNNADEFQVP